MPRLTEEEARAFLELLNRINEDMADAMEDAATLSKDDYEAKWGTLPSGITLVMGQKKYGQFAKAVYLSD